MTNPSTSFRPAFSWLLTVLLLTGVFSFQGYQSNSRTIYARPVQTELVFSGNPEETRSAVSLKIALVSNTFFETVPVIIDRVNAAFNYNRLIKVKSGNLSEQFREIKTALNCFPTQRIPHKSEEDHSPLTAV